MLITALEQRGALNMGRVEPVVREILAEVKRRGDAALREYAGRFDSLGADEALLVSREEMKAAWDATEPKLQKAMSVAQANIRAFAEAQLPKEWTISPVDGVKTGQIVRALGSVGCYVPGGRYPLPSTLLMTVTPAQVAGVARIVVCSPKPAQETLAAAWLAGVTEFYRVGGAQAIAAMAFGTPSISRVDKIVGPGNLFVTAAKILVSNECGIDMPAGPTEIGVTSETGDAAGIAADLVAQAEHDPEALAVLITSNAELAAKVEAEVKRQAKNNALARQALAKQGCIFVTSTVAEAQELTNRLGAGTLDGRFDSGFEVGEECWQRVCRRVFAAVAGRLRLRTEPCAADGPEWARPRRVERDGFREGDYSAAIHREGAATAWTACGCISGG